MPRGDPKAHGETLMPTGVPDSHGGTLMPAGGPQPRHHLQVCISAWTLWKNPTSRFSFR